MLHCTSPVMAYFVAKVFFALVIKISFGCTRDFRVKMWGTSSPDDKLAGDLGNAIVVSIDGRRSDCLAAGKLAPGNLGLLQQHRSKRESAPFGLMAVNAIRRWWRAMGKKRHPKAKRLMIYCLLQRPHIDGQ